MNKSLNIVSKFNKNDILSIFEFLMQKHSPNSQQKILKHSIVDLSENKVYNLEFPLDFNGTNLDSVIKSVEKWEERNDSSNIFIGNDEYIDWKEMDWRKEPSQNIDEQLQPLEALFQKLETVCDRMCCGIEAFDFRPEAIREAGKYKNINWNNELSIIITRIDAVNQRVVSSSTLNQLFEKSVFIKLLNHLKTNLN